MPQVTGYQPPSEQTANIRDLFLYDVPKVWDAPKVVEKLNCHMGSVISATIKPQGKYCSVRTTIVLRNEFIQALENNQWTIIIDGMALRWFPGDWTLKERKRRSEFCAVIEDSPAGLTTEALIQDQIFLLRFGVKSYKILRLPNNKAKFLAYFENFDACRAALHTPTFHLFGEERKWTMDNFSPRKGKRSPRGPPPPPKDQKSSNKNQQSSNKSSKHKSSTSNKKNRHRKNSEKSRDSTLTIIADLLSSLIKTQKKDDKKYRTNK